MRSPCCLCLLLLAGCQSLTGLSGSSAQFGCKAPDGVACSSVSGVHANLMADNLPFQRLAAQARDAVPVPSGSPLAAREAGQPLRQEARILRIWIAPWIDDEDTLHDQSLLYAQVDRGRWQIGEIRQHINQPPPQQAPQPRQAGMTPASAVPPAPARSHKPLADVRTNQAAQATARAAIQATQRHGEQHP